MAQLELVHPAAPANDDTMDTARPDHAVIARMIGENARVLDVGCGDGALMRLLRNECGANVRGLEIDAANVHGCVKRGLSVVQGDAERNLGEFPSASFDYVVLSHTLQSLLNPEAVLRDSARIGERVIVSITNAAHWPARFQLLFGGKLARARGGLLQPMSVRDFVTLARGLRLSVERAVPLSGAQPGAPFAKTLWRANWFAQQAVFLLAP